MKKLFFIVIILLCLIGCSKDNTGNNNDDNIVSYMEAKEMIINDGAILVDVRTSDEYNEKHIDGAVLLTLDTITEDTASKVIQDKETPVIVYCRSGNRSSQAVTQLNNLGYTNVYDLGSIDNWEE